MKTSLLIIIGICRIISSQGRLTQKYTTQAPLRTESKPPVRLVRDIFNDDSLTGFSREEDGQSDEFVQSYNRRARYFNKPRFQTAAPAHSPRLPRGSGGNATTKITETKTPNQKTVLIKKPIPKYTDGEYEEDFQIRISKAAKSVADSGEHEDEDFNVDDYDFDVNHDEFAGRGKPLEPRMKNKEMKEPTVTYYMQPSEVGIPKPKPEVKVQSKINIPSENADAPKKKEVVIKSKKENKIAEKIKDDDYYEDIVAKDSAKQKIRAAEDEFAGNNEESKEFDQKRAFIRNARSPWDLHSFADEGGEKSSPEISKVLSILPMFPQVPSERRIFPRATNFNRVVDDSTQPFFISF